MLEQEAQGTGLTLRALGLWPRSFSKSPSFTYRKGTGSHPPVWTSTLGGT